MHTNYELEINVPIPFDGYWGNSVDFVAERLIEQYVTYGIKRFSLAAPSNGHMNIGCPDTEFFICKAHQFNELKAKLEGYPIQCGWWIANSLHTGDNPGCANLVDINGNVESHTTCPLDKKYIKSFSENIATFARIAKPEFIFIEDDFNVSTGCFCENHLKEFAQLTGRFYSREELKEFNDNPTPETLGILRKWREFNKDVMVRFAEVIRAELDKESPEIPMGTHQPGCSDFEAFSSEDIARALAGERHTPFSRIYAMPYCCYHDYQIPEILYHALYCKEHFNPDFKFLHESDTYPHSRYFCSAAKIKTMMSIGYSYGFDGAVFWALPFFGNPDDENAYSAMFAEYRAKFTEISRNAKLCRIKGVEITNDPFYYTIGGITGEDWNPLWTRVLGNFGIPYTTSEADIAFWDKTMAKYADDETVLKYLSKGLFLDGEAAKILCERGFGKYLGAVIGEQVSTSSGNFDQCSYEIIKDGFVDGIGNTMANARAWCPTGNGVLMSIIPDADNCEIISEVYDMSDRFMSVSMTRFINELGGHIVIMGTTLEGNISQCLYNYPRRSLIQSLIRWCRDDFAFISNTANAFCIMNECTTGDFKGMLTIVNLCDDDCKGLHIYLPESWRDAEYLTVNQDSSWVPLAFTSAPEGIILEEDVRPFSPICIKVK